MKLGIECEREDDGRWLAEVPELPGALAYGATAEEAMARAEALALRVVTERIEHARPGPSLSEVTVSDPDSFSVSVPCSTWLEMTGISAICATLQK